MTLYDDSYKYVDLKSKFKDLGLSYSGRKVDLINRLKAYFSALLLDRSRWIENTQYVPGIILPTTIQISNYINHTLKPKIFDFYILI